MNYDFEIFSQHSSISLRLCQLSGRNPFATLGATLLLLFRPMSQEIKRLKKKNPAAPVYPHSAWCELHKNSAEITPFFNVPALTQFFPFQWQMEWLIGLSQHLSTDNAADKPIRPVATEPQTHVSIEFSQNYAKRRSTPVTCRVILVFRIIGHIPLWYSCFTPSFSF